MQEIKIFNYSEIAVFAKKHNIEYNKVLSIMEADRFIPFYETSHKELYLGYGKEYGLSETLSAIIDDFVKEYGDCLITG